MLSGDMSSENMLRDDSVKISIAKMAVSSETLHVPKRRE